jgi:hypothetical protein
MKFTNKICVALGLSMTMCAAVVSTSMAAPATCAKTVILKAGPNSAKASDVAIQVKCIDATPAFGTILVIPHADIADTALATALTALSLNKTVYVQTGGTVNGSLLTVMYLNK